MRQVVLAMLLTLFMGLSLAGCGASGEVGQGQQNAPATSSSQAESADKSALGDGEAETPAEDDAEPEADGEPESEANPELKSNPEPEPEPKDETIECSVYLVDEQAGTREYQLFYYGCDTHTLMAMADETVFDRSVNFTYDVLSGLDYERIWPGVSELDFVTTQLVEQEDCLVSVVHFDRLDRRKNLRALDRLGILPIEGKIRGDGIDADALMRLTEERGGLLLSANSGDFARLIV